MAMTKQEYKNDCMILSTIEELVPKEHLVRKIDNCIDFRFIEDLVKELYSIAGRPSIPPVVLFKLIFINIIFGINSMRRTCEECKVNIAYRWFLGLSIYDEIPNYSTWSQNYIRRYKDSEIFNQIFDTILKQAIEYGFVDMETIFGDGTHQKANANKNKHKDVEVEIVKKVYEEAMLEEINKDRIAHGKKPLKDIKKIEIMFDEETGEAIDSILSQIPIGARAGSTLIMICLTEPSSISSRADTGRMLSVFMACVYMMAGIPSTGISDSFTDSPLYPGGPWHRKPRSPRLFTQSGNSLAGTGEARVF